MFIRHSLPQSGFTKIDRNVFTHRGLSDGAKVLYGYLCGLFNGADKTDSYLMKSLDISRAALARRKKELTVAGLILVEQIQPRVYVIYIGYINMPASAVKAQWNREGRDL